MPERNEHHARTRAIARLIGPYIAIVTLILICRVTTMSSTLTGFFENDAIVWMSGGIMLGSGLAIMAFHQHWRGLAAILISIVG